MHMYTYRVRYDCCNRKLLEYSCHFRIYICWCVNKWRGFVYRCPWDFNFFNRRWTTNFTYKNEIQSTPFYFSVFLFSLVLPSLLDGIEVTTWLRRLPSGKWHGILSLCWWHLYPSDWFSKWYNIHFDQSARSSHGPECLWPFNTILNWFILCPTFA